MADAERPGLALRRAAAILLVLASAACEGALPPPIPAGHLSAVDDAGRSVVLPGVARRILSLVPSATETLVALGAAERIVGRTAFDTMTAVAHARSFGATQVPSVEAVLELRPDLVIAPPDGAARILRHHLGAHDVALFIADPNTLDAVLAGIRGLGRLVGREEAAQAMAHTMAAELAHVRPARAGQRRVRVLYLLWPDPPRVAGRGWMDELIRLAGGRNVFADATVAWPMVSLEAVVIRAPEVIVMPDDAAASLAGLPGWGAVPAVRAGRVVRVPAALFHRPGPRLPEAARTLAAAIDDAIRPAPPGPL